MKKLRWALLIILLFILILLLLAFSNDEIKTSETLSTDFLIDRVIFKSDLDIYEINSLKLNEKEVNALISEDMIDRINTNLNNKNQIEKIYLDLENNFTKIRIKLKDSPLIISLNLDYSLKSDRIDFTASNFYIGRLPLPNFLLSIFGLEDINDSLYVNTDKLQEIDIKDISIDEDSIEIKYKTNNDKIIEEYVPGDQKDFIREIEDILDQNKDSKKLANSFLKISLLYSTKEDIPDSLLEDLKNSFIKIDNDIKADLIFTILKYNANYFLDILN